MSNFDTRQHAIHRTPPVIVAIVAIVAIQAIPAVAVAGNSVGLVAAPQSGTIEASPEGGPAYRVLATNRTSTMQRELNQAAAEGYRFETVMGGDTAFGGKEVVAIVSQHRTPGRYAYRLLATLKTSTMQEEIQSIAAAGFHYRDQTVFKTAFGGEEVVVIFERDNDATTPPMEYLLLATSRTSTLQSELDTATRMGYEIVGMTVGETSLGGKELVAIMRRLTP